MEALKEATNCTEKSAAVLLEYKGNSKGGDDDGKKTANINTGNFDGSTDSTKTEMRDDLIIQTELSHHAGILARLDGPSFREALHQDARSINDNFFFRRHFPWHHQGERNVLPQKIMKTIPKDIDDLHAITLCEDDVHAPFGDFQGPFGFGRYENGHALLPETSSLTPDSGASAAARRSCDPGVLELFTQIPSPSSSKNRDCTKMPSRLPYNWGKRGQCSYSVSQQMDNPDSPKQEAQVDLAKSDFKSQKLRVWHISSKVGGVSTRSTLFPPSIDSSNADCDQGPENIRRRVNRPMLRFASLPNFVKHGMIVSIETSKKMDKSGFAQRLGSYDCRFTSALLNSRKEVARAKHIQVGRTRRIWSNLIQDEEPSPSSREPRPRYNSLITGQRLGESSIARPTEVKVGVRLNGTIIMEEAEAPITRTNFAHKRKHSTRQAEDQGPPKKSRIQCPESRTDEEIDAALHNHYPNDQPQNYPFTEQGTENGSVVYIETGTKSSSCSIDRNDIITNLLKSHKKPQKKKRSASSNANSTGAVNTLFGGSKSINKCNAPRFAFVPLEDGQLQTVCLTAGNMIATAVHQVIYEASQQDTWRRCSICWSEEGLGKEGVQECTKCGLLAHSSCFFSKSKGSFSNLSSDCPEKFTNYPPGPKDTDQDKLDIGSDVAIHLSTKTQADGYLDNWQCAVCCHFTEAEAPRNASIPSCFIDTGKYPSSNNIGENNGVNKHANVPGPRCTLCPHRGGAMSLLKSSDGSDQSPKWAHEVCRIWSGLDTFNEPKTRGFSLSQQFPSRMSLTNVCALCGTGNPKGNKSTQFNAGLTKCAAQGCHVVFHPMCALLANLSSKVCTDVKGSKTKQVRTRKTRHTEKQIKADNKPFIGEDVEADKKLCNEYTLQMVQVTRTEKDIGSSCDETKMAIIPVAFCGIHNPQRKDCFYGCLPGGVPI